MSDGHVCKYCGNIFKRRPDLTKHQKCAKYCLKLRGLEGEVINIGHRPIRPILSPDNMIYICSFCDQQFTRKDNLRRHQYMCKSTLVHEQDLKIEDLRQEIITMMSVHHSNVPNVNNRNVVVNNLQPITDEHIQEHLNHLTLNFIQEGAKGFADFANNYPFRGRILCTDKSRRKLRYRDDAGDIIDDGGGIKLAQRFFQLIAPRNEEIINQEYNAIQQEVHTIANEGNSHITDLSGLLNKATQLQETLRLCKQAAEGGENELTDGFIRHLTKIL